MQNAPLILYIEDNQDNRKLVSRVLLAAGFRFHGVSTGSEALAFLETQTPDLVLMDINLPEIDGYSMTRQLRRQTRFAHLPIVALTANVMKADREKSLAAGCNGFIQKPINVDRLPDQVWDYLNGN
ncbi:MAG: response regulator [Anaerolineales bacterium]|nr:response regulator [Anaerolineales bacterium]